MSVAANLKRAWWRSHGTEPEYIMEFRRHCYADTYLGTETFLTSQGGASYDHEYEYTLSDGYLDARGAP